MMRGSTVLVRAYGGALSRMRVWEVWRDVVFVSSEENYERLAAGVVALWPVGVPAEDVFTATDDTMKALSDTDASMLLDSGSLQPWLPTVAHELV
mgnify:CR=1 FL=1